ncbi:hypothetical protein ANN_22107 [Periplaneta americana]|uniref:HTH araC/xylS-type domain-containing protein n=1 Tax=Periplaneta americana TaxID=6978 RepID=A0ABQ8S7H0_PERAM|nr:hypothetical protein ANN_22107 [Periplaneta americana]
MAPRERVESALTAQSCHRVRASIAEVLRHLGWEFMKKFSRRFQQAFGLDGVDWNKLMIILMKIDVDWKDLHMKQRGKVRIAEEMSEGREIGKNVHLLQPSAKKLKKILVMCFAWSMALYEAETWTLQRSEEKRIKAFEMWIWRRGKRVK